MVRTAWQVCAMGLLATAAWAQSSPAVYRCPGPPVLYTDALTPAEAKEKGCRLIEGAPVTVVQVPKARPQAAASPAPRGSEARVDPASQRQRDADERAAGSDHTQKPDGHRQRS